MTTYIAFLRAINVGGRNLIKMADLRGAFESLRLKNVRTYIQSGNVVFEAAEANAEALAKKIEKKLLQSFGFEVPVFLRTMSQLEDILKQDPFKRIQPNEDIRTFVTFLSAEPATTPPLPLIFPKENAEVLAINNGAVFLLCRRKKNGMFGFPNAYLEKAVGLTATTRNWTTVKKIVGFASESGTGR